MQDEQVQVYSKGKRREDRSGRAYVLLHATVVVLLAAHAVPVWAQSSSFTYQGQLQDGGNPASGGYDLQFRLFDAVVGGNQVGSTQALEDVPVTAGVFTVTLDFGVAAFPGADRFLEIAVRPGDSAGAFTTLTPLQPITATPYALQCLNATTAQNASQLGGTAASQYVLTADARLTDARPPTAGSANYVQNTSDPQAGSNFNISGNGVVGGNLRVDGALNGSGANLTNLNATNVTTGTLSSSRIAVPLALGGQATLGNGIIQANNFADDGVGLYGKAFGSSGRSFGVWGVSDNPGGVGVQGTSAGGAGVQGSSAVTGVSGVNYMSSGTGVGVSGVSYNSSGTGVRGDGFSNTGANYGVYGRSNSNGGVGVYGESSNIAVQGKSSSGFAGYFDGKGYYSGNVGIGTTTPAAKLSVNGVSSTVNIETAEIVRLQRPAVAGVKNTNSAGFLLGAFETGINGRARLDISLSGLPTIENVFGTIPDVKVMSLLANGDVGIGTTTPAARLHAEATSDDSIYAHSVSGYAIHARSEQNYAGYFEGYVLFTNQVFLPTLGSAGSTTLCRNSANVISTCSSSLRYKTGVQSFSGGWEIVNRLRPIRFNWKDGGAADIGFAAEEVSNVEPLLTFRNDAGEIEGVRYDQLSAVFVNTFKELEAQIAEQRRQLDAQREQIEALKELVCAGNQQSPLCRTGVAHP
ncbi:MAG: hypothetical protein H6Q33_340 [Deltaproteobacteria bacterium]|nr:hypothetical protein [Deltaproteobacteria bacterium]